ncbi:MAG: galactokinase [Victivallaceae bacterium]|nr:galactokinase [Victivallaceae bacterium]
MNDSAMRDFIDKFNGFYGVAPTAAAQAPGRLEVLGNHTDYNEGRVLSCAVEQTTRFALKTVPGRKCRLKDFRSGSQYEFSVDDIDRRPPRDGSKYVLGMIKELVKRGAAGIGGFDAAVESSVPLSAGMSSSAALEIAAGYAMGEAFGIKLEKVEWAKAGQGVENGFLGLHTGLLDQFSSVFGRRGSMILSDFRTNEVVRTVQVPDGYVIVVINSMKKHNLVDSEYNTRRADCESAARTMAAAIPGVRALRDVSTVQLEAAKSSMDRNPYLRALHVVGECERVTKAVECLEANDIAAFGKLLFESHESSRVNFENSTPELDYLVELAKSVPGCVGARLSGGGFGGISIHLVKADMADECQKRVAAAYEMRSGVVPRSTVCSIGDGASVWR